MDEALIRLVFGMRGCGKSVKVRRLVSDIRRLLMVDTLCRDYNDGVVFTDLAELRNFWGKVYLGNFRIIYRPQGDDNEVVSDIETICEMCLSCTNMTLVIEELNIVFDVTKTPTQFNKLVFNGRVPGVELIGVAQRPVGFGRRLTSQAKEFIVFANREPDDVKYFKYYLGAEAAEAIRNLEQYQYIRWSFVDGAKNWTVCKDEPL